MKRIPLTDNLYLDEYISKELYIKYHEKKPHYLLNMLSRQTVISDQMLRDHFGTVIINNWIADGDRQWSGIRTIDSSYYRQFSEHTYGRASDKLFKYATAEEVREYIEDYWKELGITCIEKDVSWVHSDNRYILNQTKLLIV
jgi:hypothetical protein